MYMKTGNVVCDLGNKNARFTGHFGVVVASVSNRVLLSCTENFSSEDELNFIKVTGLTRIPEKTKRQQPTRNSAHY